MSAQPDSHLVERVRGVAAAFAARADGQARADLEAIVARLDEPLRVAVVGRIKAGKSTLVNAMLGQRVAPTDVSECTKVVTWFRYGHPERVEARLRDGDVLELQLDPDGTLPKTLPVQTSDVASLNVWLANDALRRTIVIDTPGLGSLDGASSAATEELVNAERGSRAAAEAADALALVLNQGMRADELDVLEGWSAAAPEDHGGASPRLASAANAVAVLSKADKLGIAGDPWAAASELAAREAERMTDSVSTVVPVIGLLAETAQSAALTETDAAALARLATVDPAVLERALWTAERFLAAELDGVAPDERGRLLARLDLYGLRVAFDLCREGVTGAGALREHLARRSGITQLQDALRGAFGRHDEALRARSALDALARMSFANDPLMRQLRDEVEDLRLEADMHELAELEALHAALTGEVALPDALREDLRRLAMGDGTAQRVGASGADAAALRKAAQQGVARWRAFAAGAPPRQARLARVAIASYQHAWSATAA